MKTVSVALVLCLNVGVDPPDFVKIDPCARLECWIGKNIKIKIHKQQTNIPYTFLRSTYCFAAKSTRIDWIELTKTVRTLAASRPVQAIP